MFDLSHTGKAMALVGVLFLAACSGTQSTEKMYKGEEKPLVQEPKKPTLDPKRLAAIKSLGLDIQTTPAKLVGLSQFDVSQALGEPSFVRKDKGVEIWQYRNAECILDLFLYESRTGFRVDHSELRGAHLDSAGELSCFKTIVMGPTS
ncbi:MAG: hypothetical protein HWE30_08705 [Methylocystaceae bacterium]|nr:hypothetical protein [Methylocystaceae bacterium]